ncbi:MAG: DUF2309 domain-containing protein [Arenicellaceae bacterium]|nr:DUF2309 domain-containing protein [Arenicellaceae bacterium]
MGAISSLQHAIEEAAEPISQFWPMKGFVHHNPIHGFEHLPFDEAIRQAKNLFGAEGYLPNGEYRGFYKTGRIDEANVNRALARLGPKSDASILLASKAITAAEVQRIHLLHGIEALEPAILDWQFTSKDALQRPRADAAADVNLGVLWQQVLSILDLANNSIGDHQAATLNDEVYKVELPFRRTLSDWLDDLTDSVIVTTIDEQMIKWVSSFVDEGMAGWAMPDKRLGFYSAWRELAQLDASGRLLGINDFSAKVAALPEDPNSAILLSLKALQIPEARWTDYLTRVLAQLSGWTGVIRWRGLNPEDPIQKACPIDIVHYLAVRLFYETELTGIQARREWNVDGNLPAITQHLENRSDVPAALVSQNKQAVCRDGWRLFHLLQFLGFDMELAREMTKENAMTMLGWLDGFPAELHSPVWLEAYEDSYRDNLLSKLAENRSDDRSASKRPLAQAVFCIDVRSEPFRRHFEQAGSVETFGYAGFFGIPMNHRSYDKDESFDLCPVLLKPSNALLELPREGQQQALENYASGSRWQQFGDHLFHKMKHSPVASFLLVDVLGIFFSVGLLGKTMLRRPYKLLMQALSRWFVLPVATKITVGVEKGEPPQVTGQPIELTRGYSVEQQATFVENGLRTIGLTENLGRFIVLCGHGSTSDNNPYYAALDCGACGGRPGDPNARTFAAMGNHPDIRIELAKRGLNIPDDTWFLPAKHDTNSDRISLYDLQDVPASHQDDLNTLRLAFKEGGEQQALDRCSRIPGTPNGMTAKEAYAHVEARGFDWANPRPEWGLSGNAAFIIGRRTMTKGIDLGGRCFLHSYDAESDPEGAILEKIMTAPLVVGEWINMEHYFSATDPWNYGSGSKVIHNVVAGVGLMYGAQSDLATGLPLQTMNNGEIHNHEPMRLLTIIEAEPNIIGAIIGKHDVLQQFFHNEWVNLVAFNPVSFEFQRYNKNATWESVEV